MAEKPVTIQAPQPTPRKTARQYAKCVCKDQPPHLHELDTAGKLKTGGVTIYSDTAPDDNKLHYCNEGLTCTRTFKIDGVSITGSGAGTLWDASYGDSAVPWRGDLHPYITAVMLGLPSNMVFGVVDVEVTPLSSTQVQVVCDYGFISAINQEPTSANDSTTPVFSIASSVQNKQVSTDYLGSPLLCSYPQDNRPGDVGSGAFDIIGINGKYVYGGASGSAAPGGLPDRATSFATADKQVPNTMLTFVRRETSSGVYSDSTGYINDGDFTVGGITYPDGTLLMIRSEADASADNGRSVLVTRQLQLSLDTPIVSSSGTSGTPVYIPAQPAIPGWSVGAFYLIQNGTASVVETPPSGTVAGSQVAQAGQIPPDASATAFQIYGKVDFSYLQLTGVQAPTPDER